MASYCYEELFRAIDYALDNYVNNQKHEVCIFANILFLLSELIERHFLERSVCLNKASDNELLLLANIIKKASMLVNDYMSNRQSCQGFKDICYLETAILIFS